MGLYLHCVQHVTVVRWEDAEEIEKVRRQALRNKGYLGDDNGHTYDAHFGVSSLPVFLFYACKVRL